MSVDRKLLNENEEEAQKFEETIIKLIGYAKNKVKYEEFNTIDK